MVGQDFQKVLAALLFTLVTQLPTRVTAQSDGSNQLVAVALNAMNWKSYDVLFRVERFDDISPEEHVRLIQWFRLTADLETDRWLYLKYAEVENVGERPLLNGPANAMQAAGLIRANGKTHFTHGVGSRLLMNEGIDFPLHSLELPDLRFSGLLLSPRLYSRHKEESFEVFLSSLRIHSNAYKADDRNDPQIRIKRTAGFERNPSEFIDTVWLVDRDSLMPASIEQYYRNSDESSLHLDSREDILWKETDGLYVPTKITGFKARKTLSVDEKSVEQLTTETNITLHWFSVNKPLDEKQFDISFISSVKSFKQHLDPHATRASTLIESVEHRSR